MKSQGPDFREAAAAFAAATGLDVVVHSGGDGGIEQQTPGLLEKKWTSVVRLQRKVLIIFIFLNFCLSVLLLRYLNRSRVPC